MNEYYKDTFFEMGIIVSFVLIILLFVLFISPPSEVKGAEICSGDKVEYKFLEVDPMLAIDFPVFSEYLTEQNSQHGWEVVEIIGVSRENNTLVILAKRPLGYIDLPDPDA